MRLNLQLLLLSILPAASIVSAAAITSIVQSGTAYPNYKESNRTPTQTSASRSGVDADVIASSTGVRTATPAIPKRSQNALSILLDALPISQVVALESSWAVERTRTRSISTSTPTTLTSSSTPTFSTITSSPSSLSTSSSAQPVSVSAASTEPTHTASSTAAPSKGLSDGAVAGVVVGSVLGAFLIVAGAILLLRRVLQNGDSGTRLGLRKSRGGSIFPESAWLYDPSSTPPRTPSTEQLRPTLHPGPQHRTPDVTMVSPTSALSQPYIMSSPERPQLMTTPNGDAWLNPFPEEPRRHDFSSSSWYQFSRPL